MRGHFPLLWPPTVGHPVEMFTELIVPVNRHKATLSWHSHPAWSGSTPWEALEGFDTGTG